MTFSIGDVLEQLSDDFPDITVSKIRFLESQGLIAPMRTASGFRMFTDTDITKLKWILIHQRDRFLPLKVIKEYLVTIPDDAFTNGNMPNFDFESSGTLPLESEENSVVDIKQSEQESVRDLSEQPVNQQQKLASVSSIIRKGSHEEQTEGSVKTKTSQHVSLLQESPEQVKSIPTNKSRRVNPLPDPRNYDSVLNQLDADSLVGSTEAMTPKKTKTLKKTKKGIVLSLDQMTMETSIQAPALKELVKFGVLEGTGSGNSIVFHSDEVALANTIAPLLERGIEVRHIKNYELFAAREAGFLEHIVQADLRRKNPEAVEIAQEKAKQFIQDTARLKEALLLKAIKNDTQT